MDNIYVYLVPLPNGVRELVTPCLDGYTVYIDESLDEAGRMQAYEHAKSHITNDDFSKSDVQLIEAERHKGGKL